MKFIKSFLTNVFTLTWWIEIGLKELKVRTKGRRRKSKGSSMYDNVRNVRSMRHLAHGTPRCVDHEVHRTVWRAEERAEVRMEIEEE